MNNIVMPDSLLDCDALTLSQRIHHREVSCREVMAATLARIAVLNPQVTAIVSLRDHDELLAEADACDAELANGRSRGWMHGFPQAPKDLAGTRSIATSRGSPLFAGKPAAADAVFVERIVAAGAILIGKTNTPEFGLGSQTYNAVFGPTGNAYDPRLTSGGSSGGAAVAVSLGLLPVADGSDMMGSLRNPAAYNNIYGFRPSAGRVPHAPVAEAFIQQLGYEGPMARSVADLARLLSTMAGPDPRAPLSLGDDPAVFARTLDSRVDGTRIGWLRNLGGHLAMEAGILDLCETALGAFTALGCTVEDAEPGFSMDSLWHAWTTLRSFLVAGDLGPLYDDPKRREMLKPEAIWEIERGRTLSAADVFRASEIRTAWYNRLLALFRRFDVLALPTAQVFPFDKTVHWPKSVAGREMDTYHRWMEVVVPASIAGVPAISVPAGFNPAGLPMGLQLIGRPKGDLDLLRIAHAYDLATKWPKLHPPRMIEEE